MRDGAVNEAVRVLSKIVLVLFRIAVICGGLVGFFFACAVTEGWIIVFLYIVLVVWLLYDMIWDKYDTTNP